MLLAGLGLVVSATASVGLTRYELDRADTQLARARAEELLATLGRELAEGDSFEEAMREIVDDARSAGSSVAIRRGGKGEHVAATPTDAFLDGVPAGSCTTLSDDEGHGWRACAAADGAYAVIAGVSLDAHNAAVRSLARSVFLFVLAVLGVLVVAVRHVLRAALGDVSALVDWTARVDARKDRAPPPHTETREIADLSKAFEALVAHLVEALEREHATSAHIAHELRTPLTALLAEMDAAPRDDTIALPRAARGDVARLAEVVEAILVLSDASAVRSETLVNVADVVRAVAPKETRVDAPDEALTRGDERLLALAVKNLVENACRHAGGPPVRVSVMRDDGALRIAVLDEGPGIARADERMFDRYWRGIADGSGRGLGLALVRAVARLHGGDAEAKAGPGERGLEVSFTVSGVERWA